MSLWPCKYSIVLFINDLQEEGRFWHKIRFIYIGILNDESVVMRDDQQGFTLIEMMIVVAIIGILAAIAVPMYLEYSVRSQVASGIVLASGAKASVTEYRQEQGVFPGDNATAGIEAAPNITGKYVSQVEVTGAGVIQVTFGNDVNVKILGAMLIMTPTDNVGSITWDCTGDAQLVDKWLPPACRP